MNSEEKLTIQSSLCQEESSDFLNQYSDKKNSPTTPQRDPYKPDFQTTQDGPFESKTFNDSYESENPEQAIKTKDKRRKNKMQSEINVEYVSSEKCFMSIAILVSKRSKDPSIKEGACIVSSNKEILSIGCNGFPNGCDSEDYPWAEDNQDKLQTKYPYEMHAALDAVLKARRQDLCGAVLYTTDFPCNECVKAIIQSGIKKIIYLTLKEKGKPEIAASRRMLMDSNVLTKPYFADKDPIQISFE